MMEKVVQHLTQQAAAKSDAVLALTPAESIRLAAVMLGGVNWDETADKVERLDAEA
jgi:hypothetical protein